MKSKQVIVANKATMWLAMFQRLRRHNLAIDTEGNFFRTWTPTIYRINFIKLIAVILIGFMAHIIKSFPYHPVTVIGSTVYASVVAACLTRHKIPFVQCRGLSRIGYYETEAGQEIPFEGPGRQYFWNREQVNPLIPNSEEDLKQLRAHTQLDLLPQIQGHFLKEFPSQNGVHVAKLDELVEYEGAVKSPVLIVNKFCGNMYYVMTMNEIWVTHIVLTDMVSPVQPNDKLCSIQAQISPSTGGAANTYDIQQTQTTCRLQEPESVSILTRDVNYEVTHDFKIKRPLTSDTNESILYSLKSPRPFIQKSLYMLHPFHFPITWDPFLTISIITLALLISLQGGGRSANPS